MTCAKGLLLASLLICAAASHSLSHPTLGLTLVELEYCAIVDPGACSSLLATVEASFTMSDDSPVSQDRTVEVAATTNLASKEMVCSQAGLVCLTTTAARFDGRLVGLGITIDASALPERVLGRSTVISVLLAPTDPNNADCTFNGPSVLQLDTTCLGPLAEGDILPGGDRAFFRVLRVYPPNCGQPISTEPSSWGAIKALYR